MNGAPITDYHFRSAPVAITYTLAYEQEQARIYAGMSVAEYDALPGTPQWVNPFAGGRSKCDMIMLYRLSHYVQAVPQDASAREAERNAQRRRHR